MQRHIQNVPYPDRTELEKRNVSDFICYSLYWVKNLIKDVQSLIYKKPPYRVKMLVKIELV